MKPVRVAIIGCGVIAPLHVECYQSVKNVEVTWLCDLVPGKSRALADRFGVANTTADAMDIFKASDVDAVSICTDHGSHADLVVAALENGKDVLCEKALAQNEVNLTRMLEAVTQHPERIASGIFQHRFDPINREIRAILQEGHFGTLLTAAMQMRCFRSNAYYAADPWRGTWAHEGGSVLINQAIHYIDQLLWLTGGMDHVVGMTANRTHEGVIETEDTAVAVLKLKCGALAILEATASSNLHWEPSLAFHGTAGALEIRNDIITKLNFTDKTLEGILRDRLAEATTPKGAEAGKNYYGPGHPSQIADFIEAVRTRRPPFVTLQSAAETVQTVFDIYQSAAAH